MSRLRRARGLRSLARVPVLCALALAACYGTASGGGGAGIQATVSDECRGDFGQSDTARAFNAFIDATVAFTATAAAIDAQLLDSCRGLGNELGMTAADLEVQGPSTLAVCGQVAARLKQELDAARAARITARLEHTEPVCVTRIDEYRRCIERCDTRVVQAGRVELRCEGGELRGVCGARCDGRCALRADGACAGTCEGTCSGGCSGTCDGICDGQCSALGADGMCHGSCRGTCTGSCSGGCSGGCAGRCVVDAAASCAGECRGGCSLELQEPVCTGRIVPPEVRTECRDVCDTVQIAHRECTPGETRLIVDAREVEAAAARVRQIAGILAARLPPIHALRHRLRDLRDAGEKLARNAGGFAGGVASLGGRALMCGAQAASALPRAVGQVSVAVEVTVTITASIDASSSTY